MLESLQETDEIAAEFHGEPRSSRRAVPYLQLLEARESRNQELYQFLVTRQLDDCKTHLELQDKVNGGLSDFEIYAKASIKTLENDHLPSLELLQQSIGTSGESALNMLKLMAKNLFALGRHKSCLSVLEEAEQVGGKSWEVLHMRGVCYATLHDAVKAMECFQEALNFQKNPRTFIHLCRMYICLGRFNEAESLLVEATAEHPNNAEFGPYLAAVALRQDDQRKATNWLGHAIVNDTSNHESILSLAAIMQQQEDYGAAMVKHRAVFAEAPSSPSLWNNIGIAFLGKDNVIATTACLKRALYLAPFDWRIHFNLGLVHLKNMQLASAFHFLSAAAQLNPKSSEALAFLGTALVYLNDLPNAILSFERCLQLDPKNTKALSEYAAVLSKTGETVRMEQVLTQLRALAV